MAALAAPVQPIVPIVPVTFTVRDALAACGVNDATLFDNETAAERLAEDMFDDSFESCKDKTDDELDGDFKTYSALTATQGQIRLLPGTKRAIKAFLQWTKDELRMGRDPTSTAFPIGEVANLTRRAKTHLKFVYKSKTLSETARPVRFTEKIRWIDWAPSFLNFLRVIPGRDGVPLKYVCRTNDLPDPKPCPDFLDEYVAMAPLHGEAFTVDAAEVHTYIVNFIAGNQTAEAKIQMFQALNNGRLDFNGLKDHFEGVGINAVDILAADKILEDLFYSGEKKPNMWWEEFEKQLTTVFTTYDRKEQRVVHSNEMKLRILVRKVNADFLSSIKASIGIEMTMNPVTLTYERALASFRNAVNSKFPPNLGGRSSRRVAETDIHGGRGRGRGFGGRGRHHGRGRSTGRGRGRGHHNGKRQRQDSSFITLTDGRSIEYHPSFKFPDDIFSLFHQSDRDRLKQERLAYKQQRSIAATGTSGYQQYRQQAPAPALTLPPPPQYPPPPPPAYIGGGATHVSQVSQGSTMMGGRNEQAMQRSQGRGSIPP